MMNGKTKRRTIVVASSSRRTGLRVSAHSKLEPLAYLFVLVFIFTIPFEKTLEIDGIGTISKLAGAPLLGLWALVLILKPRFRKVTAFHGFCLLYVAICGFSYFWSLSAENTGILFRIYVQLYLLILFMWFGLNTERRCVQALFAYLIGSWVVVLLTYYNFAAGNVGEWSGRTSIANADANETALVLTMGMPVGWYLATRIGMPGVRHLLFKLVCFSYLPAAVVAVVMTGSRGGVLSALPSVLYMLGSIAKMRLRAKVVVVAVVVTLVIVLLPYLPEQQIERISTTVNSLESGELSSREDFWRLAISIWQADSKNSLVGIGAASFPSQNIGEYVVHSTHLSILVETGILGFSAYICILLVLIRLCWRSPQRYFMLCLLCSWGIGASALTWEYRKPTWVIWSLLVCMAYMGNQVQMRRRKKLRRNKRRRMRKRSGLVDASVR